MNENIRCKIEILTDGKVNVTDTKGNPLRMLNPEQLAEALKGKTIKAVEVTPVSTYLETGSGAIFINGVWYWIP